MASILGLHHMTAICGDAQANLDFYAGVLGLRLVKRTVNFDDPGTYHLYYGDGLGRPGTILTFFPWQGAPRGRKGTGQVTVTSLAVAPTALNDWRERLTRYEIAFENLTRFDEDVLSFADPDGLTLEIVGVPGASPEADWNGNTVPLELAIRGMQSVTLSEEGYEGTAHLLTETMGLRHLAQEGNRFRFEAGEGGPGATVDVICQPNATPGSVAVGIVHHIAWRTPSDDEQAEWRADLVRENYNVSPVMDREYFHSIYFREPGGVLFEIATDPPGFMVDESAETLGHALMLPPQYERMRPQLGKDIASAGDAAGAIEDPPPPPAPGGARN